MVVGGLNYRFQAIAPEDGRTAGLTSLEDASSRALLLLDFVCYARILDDGAMLVWRESGEKMQRRIDFDCFLLSSLQPLSDPRAVAAEMREKNLRVAGMQLCEHWEFSPQVEAGSHPLSLPHDWSRFGETLVLADHDESNGYDKVARAIFAFDWGKRQVEVFPQDWFNTGDYDFGYQWIARVARRPDGKIVGDGVRIGAFELDNSNRQVRKWMTTDPFHAFRGDG